MDYRRLNRKELQVLCKRYRLPANKTNVFMADALGALLNDCKQKTEFMPSPAEVKSKVRASRSKKVAADVLEANDFSSQLARRTLPADLKFSRVEAARKDIHKAVEVKIEVRLERPQESEVVAEPAKVPRREQAMEFMSVPAEVVKSTASPEPAVKSENVADVFEAREANDLSSEFSKWALAADSEYVMAEEAGKDIHEAVVQVMIEVPPDLPRESGIVAEPAESSSCGFFNSPAKVLTSALTESSQTNSESSSSLAELFFTPALRSGPSSSPAKVPTKANSESSSPLGDAALMFFTPAWRSGPSITPAKVLTKALTESVKANSESPRSLADAASVFFTPAWSPRPIPSLQAL